MIREKLARWLIKSAGFDLGSVLSSWELNKSYGKARSTDYAALVERYKGFVYRCAWQNAQTLSSVPMKLYARGTTSRYRTREVSAEKMLYLEKATSKAVGQVTELLDHPMLAMLSDANSVMTGKEMFLLTHLFNELVGNAYWYVEQGRLGIPTGVWPLLSQYMRIVPDETNFISGYLYGKTQQNQTAYTAGEVIHFLFPNPRDYFYGYSPLEATVEDADLATSHIEFEQALYDNNARPDFMIKVNSTMSEESRKRLYAEWMQAFQGRKKQGKPVILQGDMDLKELGFSPRDTGLLMSAKFSREKIANAFGIPLTMLENSQSRAEAEAQLYGYMRDTISPRLRLFEARINERLCPLYDDRLFVVFDNPVPEDEAADYVQMDVRLRNGVTSINEERQRLGLEEVDWGNMPLLPMNLMPIGTPQPEPVAALALSPDGGEYISDWRFPVQKVAGDGHVDPLAGVEVGFARAINKVLAATGKEIDGNLGS